MLRAQRVRVLGHIHFSTDGTPKVRVSSTGFVSSRLLSSPGFVPSRLVSSPLAKGLMCTHKEASPETAKMNPHDSNGGDASSGDREARISVPLAVSNPLSVVCMRRQTPTLPVDTIPKAATTRPPTSGAATCSTRHY